MKLTDMMLCESQTQDYIVYSCIFTVYTKFKDSKTIQSRKKSEKWLFKDEETGNN